MGLGLALPQRPCGLSGRVTPHPALTESLLTLSSPDSYARPFEWKRWMRMQKESMGEIAFEEWLLEIEPIAVEVRGRYTTTSPHRHNIRLHCIAHPHGCTHTHRLNLYREVATLFCCNPDMCEFPEGPARGERGRVSSRPCRTRGDSLSYTHPMDDAIKSHLNPLNYYFIY